MCWLPRTNLSSYRAIRQQQLQPCHLCRFVVSAALNGGTLIDSLVSCPSIDPRKHCSVQTADFTSPPFWLYFFVPPTVWVYLLSDVCGLVYWNATKWTVISKLDRESSIGEVLVTCGWSVWMLQRILHWISVGNLWMVSLDVAENPPLEKCW